MQATTPVDPRVLETARSQISDLIGASPKEIIFTSGATESNNLQQEGFEITYLPVGSDGLVNLDELRAAIRPDTGLISVMAVNNEIGVIQPMEEIGESLLMGLKEVAVSSGSACTSASLEPSYVLRALGVDEDMAHTSIRFGLGRFTTEAEVDRAVDLTVKQVEKLREMSPLYEMVKEGIDIKQIQWSQH
ncbi:hypothetical protein Pint_27819 [Pistacia integerrima]|uniref:Uncharacterized protein n=1 Tax=Pistacia integerrima TaxID=434235 RepID=A0ACC0YTN5_9ROSI|nr:hypothetical protein Pint_27819 [Pistacia integerrima]